MVRPFETMRAGLFVLPSGGNGKVNHVYVDNLVDGIFAAVERDASDVYTVSDGIAARCIDYFRPIAEAAGRPRIRTLPAAVLRPAFAVVAAGASLLGRGPGRAERDRLPDAAALAASIDKARRELGSTSPR